MNRRSPFLSAAVLLSTAGACHVVLQVFTGLNAPASHGGFLLLWWVCLLLTHLGLRLFLRKPRDLRGVILLECLGFLLQLALTAAARPEDTTFLYWLGGCILWGATYIRGHQFLFVPPKAEQVMLGFEVTVAALFLAALLVSTHNAPPLLMPCLIFSALLSLGALARLRSGHRQVQRQGGRGRLLSAGLLCVPAVIAAAFALLFSEGVAGAVSSLLSALKKGGAFLFGLLEAFARWLALRAPEEEPFEGEIPDGSVGGDMSGIMEEITFFNSTVILYIVFGLVILALLVALVYALARGGRSRVAVAAVGRAEVRGRPAVLPLFLRRLKEKLARCWAYLKHYHTAPALFLWLEKRKGRRKGETPRAFLLRLERDLPHCGDDLRRLAACLDGHYFGRGGAIPPAEVRAMRRRLRRALRG